MNVVSTNNSNTSTIANSEALQLALMFCDSDRFSDAEEICRQILSKFPDHAEALHLLGILRGQANDIDAAIDLISHCLRIRPDWADAHGNLANVLRGAGRMDESLAAARRAVELLPDNFVAHYNLGAALCEKGLPDQAIPAYQRTLQLNPNHVQAMNDLGICLMAQGNADGAIEHCTGATQLNPEFFEAHNNLGNALKEKGRLDEAIASYRLALQHNPQFAKAYNNLGVVLLDTSRFDESRAAFQAALDIDPAYFEAMNNLGNLLVECGQLDESVRFFNRAIALNPNLAETHNNLGNALKSRGQLDEAIKSYQRAMQFRPENSKFHSNFIYASLFHPEVSAMDLRQLLADWNRAHSANATEQHRNPPIEDRPLRIGYISPDFRDHVVGRNILPLVQQHNRRQFEIFCYARLNRRDEMTSQFQASSDVWRDITGMSDDRVAGLIAEDGIDILVDLAVHLSDNVLTILSRKPAPIQITFAGYPGSTGLHAIDYRLTDPYLDTPGQEDGAYSEKSIYLPETFWCYQPRETLAVAPLPAIENQHITFGFLGEFCKINRHTISLWSQVMRQVEDSRLILLAPIGDSRTGVLENFRGCGIDPERIMFVARQPRLDYLRTYDLIDIGLDALPYNGHTTSLDSMWMGVPVVTRVGQTIVGRAGFSQLSNLGLTELAARTDQEFISIAANLARDLPGLANLRENLRDRMEESPLTDAGWFARNIEQAYRAVWRQWCQNRSVSKQSDRVEVHVPVSTRRSTVEAV